MVEEITFEEFDNLCKNDDSKKLFTELFELRCKKCGSTNVEIFGSCDGDCYYAYDFNYEGRAIVKCHNCGNAKVWELNKYTSDLSKLK
jgi:hypothetical protein